MSNVWHPDDDLLIPWLDGELGVTDANRVAHHLSGCRECGERLSSLRAVSYEIARLMPPPPAPWADLRSRLNVLDAGQNVQKRRRLPVHFPMKWIAVAAALVIGVVVIRLSTSPTVSAAELLRDASAAETRAEPARRIRVKTRRAVFTRPASGNVQSDVAQLFRQAGYNWEEPLSARSFSGWRNSLSQKDDRVRILSDRGNRLYRVVTSTSDGVLAEASITLRGADLRAIDSSFRFRNEETVDIAEEPQAGNERQLPPSDLARSAGRPNLEQPPAPAPDVTPSDELRVLAALHAIGADLGEPIEVRREKLAVRVSALITDPERQAQIRTALSGLRFVDTRFEKPEAIRATERAASPASAPKTNALIERLAARLGGRNTVENFTNHVLDLSEAALARALALRSLAERFPSSVESAFSETDARTLASIQADHTKTLLASVRQLTDALQPLAPVLDTGNAEPYQTWQTGSEKVLEAARTVDRTLTDALAGSGDVNDPDEALNRLARAAADLNERVTALQITLARYGVQR
jgi:anti-sigma factor RsiW